VWGRGEIYSLWGGCRCGGGENGGGGGWEAPTNEPARFRLGHTRNAPKKGGRLAPGRDCLQPRIKAGVPRAGGGGGGGGSGVCCGGESCKVVWGEKQGAGRPEICRKTKKKKKGGAQDSAPWGVGGANNYVSRLGCGPSGKWGSVKSKGGKKGEKKRE